MFAAIRTTSSSWASLALCLALLMGMGQVAHMWSHVSADHHSHTAMAFDVDTLMDLAGGDIAVGLNDCAHQHGHEGDGVSPAPAMMMARAMDPAPVQFDVSPVTYDARVGLRDSQTGRDGPDRPPRLTASA